MLIWFVPIIFAIIIGVGWLAYQDIVIKPEKKKKLNSSPSQIALNAVRYQNYGHSFDIVKYLESLKDRVSTPANSIIEYTIAKEKDYFHWQDGDFWALTISVSNIFDTDKNCSSYLNLQYPDNTYRGLQGNKPYSYYYDNKEPILTEKRVRLSAAPYLKHRVENTLQEVIGAFNIKYPFEFAEEERNGII